MAAGKLTTIVAIDVVGYSALAEADEEGALAAVGRLVERCTAAAAAHEGRIVNTAGDSVLMEFSTVAAGVQAAADLAANDDPPIRAGVHLGEVSELPSGDLLGHGVNVAARLQAQASAGAVLVSEDARRELRGPLARRLASKGVIKLPKIDERIGVFELTSEDQATGEVGADQSKARRLRLAAIGAAAVAAVVVLAVLAWPMLTAPPATRVAVLSSAPQQDGALDELTTGVADDITLALSAMDVTPIDRAETAEGAREQRLDRARSLGAELAVESAAEETGDQIRLTMNVVRTSDRATLWSSVFDGRANELPGLRQRAAERSADVLTCGVRAVRTRPELTSDVFTLLLRGCDAERDPARTQEARDTFAQVVERDPNFTYARALLALSGARLSLEAPEATRSALRESARREAERAHDAAPDIGESYVALSLLESRTNWNAREGLLRNGLERDAENATLNSAYSNLLDDLGRTAEALTFAQRGSALDPLSVWKRRNVAQLLAITGDTDQARDIIEGMTAAYPADARQWWARMRIAFWSGRYDDAVALLNDPASQARSPRASACWRQAADALRREAPSAPDVADVQACARGGDLPAVQAVLMLSELGDLDGAFALARTTFVDERRGGHAALFAPAAAAMRADPRFLLLMRDLGVLAHWHLSSDWPDFCETPGLPYACRDEASRLL